MIKSPNFFKSRIKKDSISSKKEAEENWKSFLKTLILALVCAGFVRSFFYEPFHIPSSSMKPGLLIGDYIFVSKASYGYSKYSFPFSLNLFEGRIGSKDRPQRGDVVVFRLPSDPSINYIKRVIGLPGDKIQMINGELHINGQAIAKNYQQDFVDDNLEKIPEYEEILPEGRKIAVLDQYDSPQDNTDVYTVPQGYYFMMGDNRDNSEDSRFLSKVGYVPEENLVGKAKIIFFSNDGPVWKLWLLPQTIRLNRILKAIN